MRTFVWISAIAMAAAIPGLAQEIAPGGSVVYRLEFDVRGSAADNAKGSQHYTMLIDESRKAVFQAGNRVPVAGGSPQYIDVGVRIESAVRASNGKIALDGFLEWSSITGTVCLGLCEPIVGQRKTAFHALLDPGTPKVIVDEGGSEASAPQHVEAVITPVAQ